MVGIATLIATVIGIPLGVFLATSKRGELLAMPITSRIVGAIVNALRAIPFIILAVYIFPITRWVVGSAIGTAAAIVPLTIAAIPFIARLVETHIREVDQGLVEAARAFGANPFQIIWKVLLPESLPGIVLVLTLAIISLIGFSAMVGAIGGGGLGDVALRWGYAQNKIDVMNVIVVLLIVVNQLVQMFGEYISRRINKRVIIRNTPKPDSLS
ncbi:methionine ABC transporter permease [Microvirga sp. W0021]|uniref:Methionine ABC transporter permease n=1 Tax=Hohaiivirga grylli TaxID=3133970 RepID=A0ABV0BH46_9HYPH